MRAKSVLALSILLFCLISPLVVAQVYKITDLGTLPGGSSSQALGLSASGYVVGVSCGDSYCHAFLWTKAGGMQDLGTLPGGGSYSIAASVNEFMHVAGSSDFTQPFMGNTHAFLWTSNGMLDLGTLGCPDITGANGINVFGQIVGTSTVPPCPGGGQYRAFLWSKDNGMHDLGTLPGGSSSLANSINTFGAVVGYSDCSTCSGSHPFIWTAGGMLDLGTLPGGTFGASVGVNDLEAVVGNSDSGQSGGQVHAFLWTAWDGMRDLGTLPGGTWSSAYSLNDFGYIVGSADFATSLDHGFALHKNGGAFSDTSHAFIWTKRAGMQDLNDLIVPRHSEWVLQSAQAINVLGRIVGYGTINGYQHAFLLTPNF